MENNLKSYTETASSTRILAQGLTIKHSTSFSRQAPNALPDTAPALLQWSQIQHGVGGVALGVPLSDFRQALYRLTMLVTGCAFGLIRTTRILVGPEASLNARCTTLGGT